MDHIRQQYSADYFSGANVTVSIGPCILTQAFGIQISKSQRLSPIYGYHSQHYDAISKGIITINGNLLINFVSPRYLTLTLHRFYATMYAWRRLSSDASNVDSIMSYMESTPEARDVFRAIQRQLSLPTDIFSLDTGESPDTVKNEDYILEGGPTISPEQSFQAAQYQPDFSEMLDNLFASDAAISGLQRLLWGDAAGRFTSDLGTSSRLPQRSETEKQYDLLSLASYGDRPLSHPSSLLGPDRLGHPMDGIYGIDITVTFGHPFNDQITDSALRYDHSSSIILKGVRFFGEELTIMANNEPVIESYSFLARDMHAISSLTG